MIQSPSGVIKVSTKLLPDAFQHLGWRLVLLAIMLVLSGVFEGIGLAMLFPVLAKLGMGNTSGSALAETIDDVLRIVGIPNELGYLIAAAIATLYLQVIFQTMKSWCEADCQTRYTEHWQRRIFNAFMDAQWSFFTAERAASRVNIMTNEAGRISAAFYLLEQMITSLVFIGVYAVVAAAASWQMVAILVVFGAAIYLLTRPMSRRSYSIGTQVSVVSEVLQHRATEFVLNAKLIKSTATESVAKLLFGGAAEEYRQTYRMAGFHPKLIFGIYMLAGYALLGVGTWVAVEYLKVNPAAVAVSIYVFLRLYVQLTNFQQYRHGFLLSAPAFDAVSEQVNEARAVAETDTGGERLFSGPAAIRFDGVEVRYGDVVALERVSFDVWPGAVIGVTGASGAGKSTLVDAIVGLIKPSRGLVEVDGIPIERVARIDWRRSIGYVGQETLLLNGTVGANIAWGGDYSEEAIVAAARAANAHGFISAMREGYNTEIGDRGVRLSGGQRQRLGLARALLGDKRLLILDEATSSLDSESENEIMTALETMRRQVTIIMVAHRLSTLRSADHILVFERGRLIEAGKWDELNRKSGVFSRLLALQNRPGGAPVDEATVAS